MKQKSKFIVFSHARSGSTSLIRSLSLHPDLVVIEEPLHDKYSTWHPGERNYISLLTDTASLDEQINHIFSKCDGFKIHDHSLSKELYSHLLLDQRYRVIFLWRKNLLKTAISSYLAEQTGIWHISDLKGDREDAYFNLKPVPLEDIERRLKYTYELQQYYRNVTMKKSEDIRYFIDYESLYSDDLDKNLQMLADIFSFIGVSYPQGVDFGNFLDPARAKISTESMYHSFPNADEINKQLGSDKTGWLF